MSKQTGLVVMLIVTEITVVIKKLILLIQGGDFLVVRIEILV